MQIAVEGGGWKSGNSQTPPCQRGPKLRNLSRSADKENDGGSFLMRPGMGNCEPAIGL